MEERTQVEDSIKNLVNTLQEAKNDGSNLKNLIGKLTDIKGQLGKLKIAQIAEAELSEDESEEIEPASVQEFVDVSQFDAIVSVLNKISFDTREVARYALDVDTNEEVNRDLQQKHADAVLAQVLSLYSSLLSRLGKF